MGITRTATLAIGASLLGSVPGIFLVKPGILPWISLTVAIMFLLYGTGFLQEYIIRRILRSLRKRWPVIAIINDLPWTPDSSEKRTHIWAWPDMNPLNWRCRITREAQQFRIKANVKHIKLKGSWARFWLDRYNVILNPYGSVYPEVNIKDFLVLNTILEYVLNGGLFVNVADVPFYWAYDPQREVLYDVVKYTHQYMPVEYESRDGVLCLKSAKLQSFGPYPETPFLSQVKVNVINTETIENNEIKPLNCSLRLRDRSLKTKELNSVAINRVAVVERHLEYKTVKPFETGRVESVVEEIRVDGQNTTPICYVNYGKGRFLVSLIFLDYDKQLEEAKAQITNLHCELILREVWRK